MQKPTFLIFGQVEELNEWKNSFKRNPRLVNTTRKVNGSNRSQAVVSAFGSQFPLNFADGVDVGPLEPGKFFEFVGTIESARDGNFLLVSGIKAVREDDCYVLPTWTGTGLVARNEKRERDGVEQTNVTIAVGDITMPFYAVDPDLADSLAKGDVVECSGAMERRGRLRFMLDEVKHRSGKAATPRPQTAKA